MSPVFKKYYFENPVPFVKKRFTKDPNFFYKIYQSKNSKIENSLTENFITENFSKLETENFSKDKIENFLRLKNENFSDLKIEKISDFDQFEKISKEKIWPYKRKHEDKFTDYCIYVLWKNVRKKSKVDSPTKIREYFEQLVKLRDEVEKCENKDDVFRLIDRFNLEDYPALYYQNIRTDKITVERMEETYFDVPKDKRPPRCPKEAYNKVKMLDLPKLENFSQDKYPTRDKQITTDDLQEVFGFDRQSHGFNVYLYERKSLYNAVYDSFCHLAETLGISARNISHVGKIGMGIGSKGIRKGGYVYYDVKDKTLSLMKEHSAGYLAQEWFVSLNYYLSMLHNIVGEPYTKYYTEYETLEELKRCAMDKESVFYNTSKAIDLAEGRKTPKWATAESMLSRAFTSFIVDKMAKNGVTDEFLAYEFEGIVTANGEIFDLYPRRNERIKLKNRFEKFFDELKKKGIMGKFFQEGVVLSEN